MADLIEKLVTTLRVMYFAVLPSSTASTVPRVAAETTSNCTPRDIRDMSRFVDNQGKLRAHFPACLPIAAPFILFRLKREGYSRCTVEVSGEGLLVEGRR